MPTVISRSSPLLPAMLQTVVSVTFTWVVSDFMIYVMNFLDQNQLFGPQNVPPVYKHAGFKYDSDLARFDTTRLTWLSDYMLGIFMLSAAWRIAFGGHYGEKARGLRGILGVGLEDIGESLALGPSEHGGSADLPKLAIKQQSLDSNDLRNRKSQPKSPREENSVLRRDSKDLKLTKTQITLDSIRRVLSCSEYSEDATSRPAGQAKASCNSALIGPAASLCFIYAWSVLVGGLGHHTIRPAGEDGPIAPFLNTTRFYVMWVLCTGSVVFQGPCMGLLAVGLHERARRNYHSLNLKVAVSSKPMVEPTSFLSQMGFRLTGCLFSPSGGKSVLSLVTKVVLQSFCCSRLTWIAHSATSLHLVVTGVYSYEYPASDIFALGGVQILGTIYLLIAAAMDVGVREAMELDSKRAGALANKSQVDQEVLEAETRSSTPAGSPREKQDATTPKSAQEAGKCVSSKSASSSLHYLTFYFAFNCPLIVIYPWMIYSQVSDGVLNASLHAWLAVAWGGQFWSLERGFLIPSGHECI